MINPVWNNINELRPRRTGFYLGRYTGHLSFGFFYYFKPLDYIIDIVEGCDYYYGVKDALPLLDVFPVAGEYEVCTLFWAEMPDLTKSQLLSADNGLIEVSI